MTIINPTPFTKEQLFADLKKDGIAVDIHELKKVKEGDSDSSYNIGLEYNFQKQQYDKAMAWYRLAASKNHSNAQNNIGILYYHGYGVAKDHLLALEWYLKSAIQNNKYAWASLGGFFQRDNEVRVDKYKALEWYCKFGEVPDRVKKLTEQGIQLKAEDRDKPLEQLLMETEDILWAGRKEREDELRSNINSLQQSVGNLKEASREKDARIKTLEEKTQTKEQTQHDRNINLAARRDIEDQLRGEINYLEQLMAELEEDSCAKDIKIKLLEESLQATEQRQKDIENLLITRSEIEDEFRKEIDFLKQLKTRIEEESRAKDIKIKLLEESIQKTEQRQQDMDVTNKGKCELRGENKAVQTHLYTVAPTQKAINDQQEIVEEYKREIEKLNSKIQVLKVENAIQTTQLEVKDSHVDTLEKIIASYCTIPQKPLDNTMRRIEEVERSNKSLERMFEQERRLKDNEIMFIKQEIQALLNRESQEKRLMEEESSRSPKRFRVSSNPNGSMVNADANGVVIYDLDKDDNNGRQNTNLKRNTGDERPR